MKEILASEKEFTKTNYERYGQSNGLYKNNLIHSDVNMYLKGDSLIEINN